MTPGQLAQIQLLAHPTRLRIVSILSYRRDITSTQLEPLLGVSQGTASHHLNRLHDVGLVARGKLEQSVPYRLDHDAFALLADAVRDLAGVR